MDNKSVQFIDDIVFKLSNNIQLSDYEIQCVRVALIQQNEYKQEPYYEVIYHDEYDNKERRIMEPKFSKTSEYSGCVVRTDVFELVFNRVVKMGGE